MRDTTIALLPQGRAPVKNRFAPRSKTALPNALAFTRGARTKRSATESKHEGRFTQAGAVGVQRLVGRFSSEQLLLRSSSDTLRSTSGRELGGTLDTLRSPRDAFKLRFTTRVSARLWMTSRRDPVSAQGYHRWPIHLKCLDCRASDRG